MLLYQSVAVTVISEASIPRRLHLGISRERRVPTSYRTDPNTNQLTHQFGRVFGRQPTPEELERYERARSRLAEHLPARVKRRAALLITRV